MRKLIFFLSFILFPASFSLAYQKASVILDDKHELIVDVVTSPADMRLGLGFRKSLNEKEGMLFIYKRVGKRIFWMKNMVIPIDMIWIKNKRIQKIETNVSPQPPMTLESKLPTYGHGVLADMVLEIQAGLSKKLNLTTNSSIEFSLLK